MVNARNNQYNG
jgi:hypothetical protein